MDRPTVDIYNEVAEAWRARRATQRITTATRFGAAVRRRANQQPTTQSGDESSGSDRPAETVESTPAVIVDLGCGPGGHITSLSHNSENRDTENRDAENRDAENRDAENRDAENRDAENRDAAKRDAAKRDGSECLVIGLDASMAMLALAREAHPGTPLVCADLEHLPFRSGSVDGAWASKSYVHVPRSSLPAALAELHRALAIGGLFTAVLFGGNTEFGPTPDDDFPGRNFSTWPVELLRAVLVGAGFTIDAEKVVAPGGKDTPGITIEATTIRSSPDVIGPGMRLLACGINPSPSSAESRVGYARPGNRFWPAALAAGIATVDRDPTHALANHGLGMADLVKRTTRKASEVTDDEFEAGLARIEAIAAWLQPQAICFIGLSGYRSARDPRAKAGPLPETIGGVPAYLMPSTSGLNAHAKPAELAEHLRAAQALASSSPETGPG